MIPGNFYRGFPFVRPRRCCDWHGGNECRTVHTGNVSAGTSTFAMLVLDKPLRRVYPEIDIVATPSGHPVAMSHANNARQISMPGWISSKNLRS